MYLLLQSKTIDPERLCMKILTIGGATQDIFIAYEGSDVMSIAKKNLVATYMLFESGEKIEIDTLSYQTGGGATNAAVAFKRLGFEVSCFAALGNDPAGLSILKDLEKDAVSIDQIATSKDHATGTSFIVNSRNGERTIFAFRGANGFLDRKNIPFDYIKTCDQIYITSLSNQSAQLLPEIASFAKQHNIPVAINPGTSQLTKNTQSLKESLKSIDILILNSSEARTFMIALVAQDQKYREALESSSSQKPCGVNMNNEQAYLLTNPLSHIDFYFSIQKFFTAVLAMGPKIVVITNGCNGVYVATQEEILFHPSIKVSVVNSVGAGDAFGSCFVASLRLGDALEDALRHGIINSASVLTTLGAKPGLLTRTQLNEKMQKLPKNLIQRFSHK